MDLKFVEMWRGSDQPVRRRQGQVALLSIVFGRLDGRRQRRQENRPSADSPQESSHQLIDQLSLSVGQIGVRGRHRWLVGVLGIWIPFLPLLRSTSGARTLQLRAAKGQGPIAEVAGLLGDKRARATSRSIKTAGSTRTTSTNLRSSTNTSTGCGLATTWSPRRPDRPETTELRPGTRWRRGSLTNR